MDPLNCRELCQKDAFCNGLEVSEATKNDSFNFSDDLLQLFPGVFVRHLHQQLPENFNSFQHVIVIQQDHELSSTIHLYSRTEVCVSGFISSLQVLTNLS